MANFSGQLSAINRFLGFLDADDPTNVPVGLSALVRNCSFELTSVRTRDGINLTMQGINKKPITGLIGALYTPQTADEQFFQLPMIFDFAGSLQYEKPVGTGRMNAFDYGIFTPPAQSHMIACQTYDKVFSAFSNLIQPLSTMAVIDPKTLKVWPYGMKPFGWAWTKNTQILKGEVATPTGPNGNGHTYVAQNAGTTGALEPVWPLTEEGTVNDGSVTWMEYTAVMANRIPEPGIPNVTTTGGGGGWPAAYDLYIRVTLTNNQGETTPSAPFVLGNLVGTETVHVPIPGTTTLTPTWLRTLAPFYIPREMNVFTSLVPTGNLAPPISSYQLAGTVVLTPLAQTLDLTAPGAGVAPPTANTARVVPGQLPTPDTQPDIQRIPGAGLFPAGRDIYVRQSFTNDAGETKVGPASFIENTAANDAIQVTVQQPVDENNVPLYTMGPVNIYEADVATGEPAPSANDFQLVGSFQSGTIANITQTAVGVNPSLVNSTGPAGNIQEDTETGGINGTQGYRYMAIMFMNQNYTVSGFTLGSVQKYIVDEDGWQLGVFKIPTGPDYVLGRALAFSVADGTNAGPFWWIGNPNLQYPAQNFVYPQTVLSAEVAMTSTFLEDNVSTSATFNFTDDYLKSSNDATDRLDIIWPNQAVHCAYCPSVDRIFQSGVPGYYSGWWVSLAADPESYYKDLSFISVGADDGERSWGVIEYRGTVYGLRERSGFTLSASPSNPQSWSATKRWTEVGPCGPRAFDACGMFMIFVHRSGIYKYEDTTPDLMTKEIPNWWKTVNWLYAHTICVKIDHERHEVHILVPVGNSTVPNQEIVLNYLEGWQNPVHYTPYAGKEVSMDSCRKYSINDVSAWVCDRIERTIDYQNYPWPYGDVGMPFGDKGFGISQFIYGSSADDGTVHAVTPGIFSDNGAGIDCQYETVCSQTTMALIKIEGFTLNARGNGTLYPYFIAGRAMVTGYNQQGQPLQSNILPCRPIDLQWDENEGLSRMVPSKVNERWRMRFTNGKVKDSWFSLKWLGMYTIPFASARPQSQQGG